MDENKRLKLFDMGYKIMPTCKLCVYSRFQPETYWGTCSRNAYEHEKHSDAHREVSINAFGYCPQFKFNDEQWKAHFSAFMEFGALLDEVEKRRDDWRSVMVDLLQLKEDAKAYAVFLNESPTAMHLVHVYSGAMRSVFDAVEEYLTANALNKPNKDPRRLLDVEKLQRNIVEAYFKAKLILESVEKGTLIQESTSGM